MQELAKVKGFNAETGDERWFHLPTPDADEAVAAFWSAALNETERFVDATEAILTKLFGEVF